MFKIFEIEETTSTNDEAAKILSKVQEPVAIVARRQTAGRGRRGRQWISQEGNLFCSLTFKADLQDLGCLVILSGLAVLKTINKFCPQAHAEVKWPNDVMIDGAKISGILFENAGDGFWIMGVGINIVSAPEKGIMYPTCSLRQIGGQVSAKEVLHEFLLQFEQIYELWRHEGFTNLKKTWLDKAYKRGKKILIKQDNREIEGIFQTIDDQGSLILLTTNGSIKIIVGDVY